MYIHLTMQHLTTLDWKTVTMVCSHTYIMKVKNITIELWLVLRVNVFNATFNNISVISWRSVLLMEETRVSRENHRTVASH